MKRHKLEKFMVSDKPHRRQDPTVIYVRTDKSAMGAEVNPPQVVHGNPYCVPGDHIEWKLCRSKNCWTGRNQSVRVLYATQFRRALTGLINALSSPHHALERVIIRYRDRGRAHWEFIARPYDARHSKVKRILLVNRIV